MAIATRATPAIRFRLSKSGVPLARVLPSQCPGGRVPVALRVKVESGVRSGSNLKHGLITLLERVARDMPFSRDRIPRVCRVGRGTPRPTRTPRYFLGEGIGRDVAQRYRPLRDLALLGYAECSRQKSGRVAQRPLRPPHPRPISPGHTGGEGSKGSLRATATLIVCASIL